MSSGSREKLSEVKVDNEEEEEGAIEEQLGHLGERCSCTIALVVLKGGSEGERPN